MSSFSSVVRKTGTSIKPKAQPRRNVTRVHRPLSPVAAVDSVEPGTGTEEIVLHNEDALQQNDSVPQEQSPSLQNAQQSLPSDITSSVRTSASSKTRAGRSSNHTSTPDSTRPRLPSAGDEVIGPYDSVDTAASSLVQETIQPSSTPSISNANNNDSDRVSEPPNKRRKLTPRATQSPASIRNTSTIAQGSSAQQVPKRSHSESQPPADLIQLATERAASVSTLANNIDIQTRARTLQRSVSTITDPSSESAQTVDETAKQTKKRGKKSAAERAAEVIAAAVGETDDGHRRRHQTPEGAELYQLEPDAVTMGELVRDRKLGKKSQLEQDMQRDWQDIVRRRKEARDLALENAQKGRRKAFGSTVEVPLQATVALGPRTEVRNGRIVVIEESRQIDRNGALEQAAVLDAENIREDKFYYKRVNQGTVGMKAHASRKFRWDQESTEQFFRGLQMFGTDFLMIANMFPGLDRKQIKMKFIREENADKVKVKQALAERIPIDLDEYAKMTDTTLQDPQSLQAEIDAEEERLKEEDHQRRVREGFVNTTAADNPVPTTEGEETAVADEAADNGSRFASMAEDIMAPKKRQRKTGSTLRKRGPKTGRRPAEGVEEILGSIDEVRV